MNRSLQTYNTVNRKTRNGLLSGNKVIFLVVISYLAKLNAFWKIDNDGRTKTTVLVYFESISR